MYQGRCVTEKRLLAFTVNAACEKLHVCVYLMLYVCYTRLREAACVCAFDAGSEAAVIEAACICVS